MDFLALISFHLHYKKFINTNKNDKDLKDGVTVVVTSCGRPNHLEGMLLSFIKFNTYPIDEMIIIEDAGCKDSINAAKKSAADRHNEFKKKILSCDQSVIEKFRLYFTKFNQTSRSNINMNHFDVGLPVKLQYADRILESYEIKELTSLVTCFTNNILISGLSGKFNNRPEMQVWLNKSQDIIDSSLDSDHLKVSSLLKTNDIKIFLIMILQFLLLILPVMMINQSSFSPRGSKGEFEL